MIRVPGCRGGIRCAATRRGGSVAAAVIVAVGLGACGGNGSGGVVVHVGDVAVTQAALEHRMVVVAHEAKPHGTRQQQALSLLISSLWLLGEAAKMGEGVSGQEVQRRFEERNRSFPNGPGELGEYLKVTGQTVTDVKFGIEVELAADRVLGLLKRQEPPISQSEIAAYYVRNKRSFRLAEMRQVELFNSYSKATAAGVKRRVAPGRSLATAFPPPTVAGGAQRELVVYTMRASHEMLRAAILAARPGDIVGPLNVSGRYTIFKVTHVTPAIQQTLAQVHGTIAAQLQAEQSRRTIAGFVAALSRQWTPRTDCRPGYVVQKCRQYSGPKAPEEDPLNRPGAAPGVNA